MIDLDVRIDSSLEEIAELHQKNRILNSKFETLKIDYNKVFLRP